MGVAKGGKADRVGFVRGGPRPRTAPNNYCPVRPPRSHFDLRSYHHPFAISVCRKGLNRVHQSILGVATGVNLTVSCRANRLTKHSNQPPASSHAGCNQTSSPQGSPLRPIQRLSYPRLLLVRRPHSHPQRSSTVRFPPRSSASTQRPR